jgi:hypothetical protein
MAVIYALIQPKTEEIRYIGKTEHDQWKRYGQHIAGATAEKARSRRLTAWIKSVRPDLPGLIVLETDPDGLNEAEKRWIAWARANGYRLVNMTDGGDGQSRSYVPSAEARAKVSASLKGRVKTDLERQHISEALKGHPVSDETKAKIAAGHKGKPLSDEHKQAIGRGVTGEKNGFYGKMHTEEVKARISRLGWHHSDETKSQLSVTNRQYRHSPEAREKMRQAALAREAAKKALTQVSATDT